MVAYIKWSFLISATINHITLLQKLFPVSSIATYYSISLSGDVMTFPAKKVKICGLKAAFMFKKQKLFIFSFY